MSTITLYASKINQMPSLINDAKKSVKEYKSDLKSLKSKVLTIDGSVCNVDDVISSIKSSSQIQEDKIDALDSLEKDVNEFVSDVVRIDGDAADAINKSKDDFYDKYEYLKPECEKTKWEKFKDSCKKVSEWCKEHWKAIVTIAIVITAVVILVACPACGAIIAGACWGAISGAVIGGVAGGLTSLASGGSFWEGVEDGAFSGAISGAIFGGLGGAGQLAGNVLGKSCAFVEKFGSAIKWTSRISAGISGVMGLYDTATFAVGLFAPDCAFVQFNQKLHSSKLYNGFQMGVSALSIFTGGMRQGMSQVTPSCFVAGTMILTAMGLVAIENITAGDKVISTDPDTMETDEKIVLETYIREVTTLVHLTVNGEEIITTVDHPFYVKDKGFINAGELRVGSELLDSNGNILLVENLDVELTDEPVKVYNFQVEDFHTYHVCALGVLVHNAGDDYRNVPVPERRTASNGLDYKSNPKHTPGQPGNRPNAGTEPRNSFELFGDSTPSNKNPRQRYTYEKSTGTLHRFSPTENDGSLWHWSGSTNQGQNSLKGSQVPNDIKNLFHLPKKGW